jgi:hypothetical protein
MNPSGILLSQFVMIAGIRNNMIRLEDICDSKEQVELIRYACKLFNATKLYLVEKKSLDKSKPMSILKGKYENKNKQT